MLTLDLVIMGLITARRRIRREKWPTKASDIRILVSDGDVGYANIMDITADPENRVIVIEVSEFGDR